MIQLTHARDHLADAPASIRVLTINHPPEHRWNADTLEQLHQVLADLAREAAPPSLVITGSGPDWFCGGTLDSAVADDRVSLTQLARLYSQAFSTLRRYPSLTVAAVNGQARDEGISLALSCDLRVASAHALFGFDAPREGRVPMGGSSQLLPRLVGESATKRMMLCGLQWSAQQALAAGLVDAVSPGSPVVEALTWLTPAQAVRAQVVQAVRQLVEHARMRPLETGFAAERDWQAILAEDAGPDTSPAEHRGMPGNGVK
ncbi:short chain enoyl-CoA hydratase [Marinobacter daqiaonensis]|uniref:Short chain enoyl-CoA hydratase n=1 Tax=Marinobacter daqiaonensis TaxID=650891 RepID=A0A1I6H0P1_9GAMM|nr:enoyl-CoA hydratase-related protein [Marinobacter daqiaonensis]SFR47861.1 short chain enoyl-CoA hydratase [Marinobacter daqiaonensis]